MPSKKVVLLKNADGYWRKKTPGKKKGYPEPRPNTQRFVFTVTKVNVVRRNSPFSPRKKILGLRPVPVNRPPATSTVLHFADIILPLALPKRTYTYAVPDELLPDIQPGVRVEVPFGKNKLYSGVVERVHAEKPEYRTKPIFAVLDEVAVVTERQLKLWDWIADYYCCTLGEVMSAALPSHLKLTSETKLVRNPAFGDDFSELDADEYLLAEALHLQNEVTIDDARKILNKKTVFPAVQRLLLKGVLSLREDLQEKYRPKKVIAVRLAEPYRSDQELLRPCWTNWPSTNAKWRPCSPFST
jgi:primosomal protein N' (replication factor Y) (superfamily II helicase)